MSPKIISTVETFNKNAIAVDVLVHSTTFVAIAIVTIGYVIKYNVHILPIKNICKTIEIDFSP